MDLQLRYFGELKTEYVDIGSENKIGIKLDRKDISQQLQSVLERYKSGQINESQAKFNNRAKKSIEKVEIELKKRLEAAEQNIRQFLAIKIILDTVAEVVELDLQVSKGLFADQYERLNAFVTVYNFRLECVREGKYSLESEESTLEKVLKLIPAINLEKLKPSSYSLKQLKDEILKDAYGEDWLQVKVLSLEYKDGFSFTSLIEIN